MDALEVFAIYEDRYAKRLLKDWAEYSKLVAKAYEEAPAYDGSIVGAWEAMIPWIDNMPKMNGEAFLTELRKLDKSIPVVFLTTEYEDWLKKKILELGANGWITKPVKTQSFRDTIEAMLE